ncbi:MAG TPA: YfcE family phosphodiesterase, partial [Desulfomonilia bacterium]|nr:YfcE family phosphodiesterase [Desulfomonilia bacterium]
MKRIGILSDTHMNKSDAFLEEIVSKHFADVDFIIHAGDLVSNEVLDVFSQMDKEVIAVCGNMDDYDVRHAFPVSRT